ADEQPQGGGRADPPDPGSGPLTAVERGDETVFGTVGAQGGTVGGGVADPAAEGARRQVPARGVGGDGDGCEQGELEAFGGAEAQGVELVEGGHGGHGHRGRGSESELPSVGVVEFAGDVEVEVAGGDTAGGTQLLERRDRREHVVGGTVLEDDGLTALLPPPHQRGPTVFGGVDATGVLALGQPHRDAPVDGHEHGRVRGGHDSVVAGDEQLAGRPGDDHARPPSDAGSLAGTATGAAASTAAAGTAAPSAVHRWAPGPGPTTRTSPKAVSRPASAPASEGRTMTATVGPASAVE